MNRLNTPIKRPRLPSLHIKILIPLQHPTILTLPKEPSPLCRRVKNNNTLILQQRCLNEIHSRNRLTTTSRPSNQRMHLQLIQINKRPNPSLSNLPNKLRMLTSLRQLRNIQLNLKPLLPIFQIAPRIITTYRSRKQQERKPPQPQRNPKHFPIKETILHLNISNRTRLHRPLQLNIRIISNRLHHIPTRLNPIRHSQILNSTQRRLNSKRLFLPSHNLPIININQLQIKLNINLLRLPQIQQVNLQPQNLTRRNSRRQRLNLHVQQFPLRWQHLNRKRNHTLLLARSHNQIPIIIPNSRKLRNNYFNRNVPSLTRPQLNIRTLKENQRNNIPSHFQINIRLRIHSIPQLNPHGRSITREHLLVNRSRLQLNPTNIQEALDNSFYLRQVSTAKSSPAPASTRDGRRRRPALLAISRTSRRRLAICQLTRPVPTLVFHKEISTKPARIPGNSFQINIPLGSQRAPTPRTTPISIIPNTTFHNSQSQRRIISVPAIIKHGTNGIRTQPSRIRRNSDKRLIQRNNVIQILAVNPITIKANIARSPIREINIPNSQTIIPNLNIKIIKPLVNIQLHNSTRIRHVAHKNRRRVRPIQANINIRNHSPGIISQSQIPIISVTNLKPIHGRILVPRRVVRAIINAILPRQIQDKTIINIQPSRIIKSQIQLRPIRISHHTPNITNINIITHIHRQINIPVQLNMIPCNIKTRRSQIPIHNRIITNLINSPITRMRQTQSQIISHTISQTRRQTRNIPINIS